MQEYWPHYALTYQPADSGPAALKLTTESGKSGPEALVLVAGKPQRVAGTTLQLVEGAPGSGGAGLVFTRAPDGALTARPSQPMQRMDMASGEIKAELPAGADFAVEELVLYRVVDGGFQFVLQENIPTSS